MSYAESYASYGYELWLLSIDWKERYINLQKESDVFQP